MTIRTIEQFLDAWDLLGDLVELEAAGKLTPDLQRQWDVVTAEIRRYEDAEIKSRFSKREEQKGEAMDMLARMFAARDAGGLGGSGGGT